MRSTAFVVLLLLPLPARPAPGPGGTLVVLNKSDATASLLDVATGKVVATVLVGEGPHEVAVSPDGRTAAVSNYGLAGRDGKTLTLIDVPSAGVVATIDLGEHRRPHGIRFTPDGKRLVVTSETSGALLVVDLPGGKVAAAIPTEQKVSHMVALSRDGRRAFVANIGSGSVTAIDLVKGERVKTVETGAGAEGIAVSPDGRELWVANRAADTVSVLSTSTLEVLATLPSSTFPIRVAFTPDGKRALVSNARSGDVTVFDAASRKELRRIPMKESASDTSGRLFADFGKSPAPIGILVAPDGDVAWIANANADVIAVLDLVKNEVIRFLKAGREPDGLGFSPLAIMPRFGADSASRFATLALDCVHREYPNKIAHALNSDADVLPPRRLTPVFYGCYDWHSAVHGHWLLVRLARTFPEAPFATKAREALRQSFRPDKVEGEVRYLNGKGRATFERPYGLAWLLQLCAELKEWDDPDARRWAVTLRPLEEAAVARLREWLPKLSYPIREGEHAQTAFAFGLALDWARSTGAKEMAALLESRARDLYERDRDCPLAYEPSGQDFLSPCFAEADLMRRVLAPERFAAWLGGFLPTLPREESADWLAVGVTTDPSDGKLAHLDGLNLSRAFMLEGIAAALPPGDPRLPALRAAAVTHRTSGLKAVTGAPYEGGHWLGTFATYLVTGRGLPAGARP